MWKNSAWTCSAYQGTRCTARRESGLFTLAARIPQCNLNQSSMEAGKKRGLRSGTVAVPSVVALGVACELAEGHLATEPPRLRTLRDRLSSRLLSAIPTAVVHGRQDNTLPGLLNLGFPGVDGDDLIHCLKGVAVSQGSSCSSGKLEPSHVLRTLGISDDLARASLRFGVGRLPRKRRLTRR